MKIQLAQHYGLCFGVRDALAEAERLAQTAPLTVLGELVHNPVVRERLDHLGVHRGVLEETSAATPQVMITAHGASDTDRARWRTQGYGVADGTCPLVRHAHDQLRLLVVLGYFPVVIGQRGHVEVRGLTGDFSSAFILQSAAELADLPDASHYGVVSQTTQPVDKVYALVAALRRARPDAKVHFRDTVCQPTKNRQNALRQLIAECDTIVVVGGRNSNNTLQLVAAAVAAGRAVHHVERPDELDPAWFHEAEVVGITAGTSTLKETVAAVHARLEQIAAHTEPALATNH